jgi:hypothetical protein
MSSVRLVVRSVRPSRAYIRPLFTIARRMASPGNADENLGAADHRNIQTNKPLDPHMTNATSTTADEMLSSKSELGVGELEGAKFRIEPLRRTGEDPNTTRARLLCSPITTSQ